MKNLLSIVTAIIGCYLSSFVFAENGIFYDTSSNITYIDTNGKVFTGIGTITLTFGDESLTILDRNLGANIAGTGCSDFGCTDQSFGYYFQRGNNFGFVGDGEKILNNTYSGYIDVSDYSWNSPYVGGTFIIGVGHWNNSDNQTLWGGGGDTKENDWGKSANNHYQRQGPCPAGYHVPSIGEMNTLLSGWAIINGGASKISVNSNNLYRLHDKILVQKFKNDFLIPFAGYARNELGSIEKPGESIFLGTTSSFSGKIWRSSMNSNGFYNDYSNLYGYGYQIRCFKDNKIYPIISYETNGGTLIQSQTILSGEKGYIPGYFPQKTGAVLMGWYKDSVFENNIELSGFSLDLEITKNTKLYVKWGYKYTFLNYDNSVISSGIIAENELISAPNYEVRSGYNFIGRFDKSSNSEFNFQNGITGNVVIYPKYDLNEYYITFVDGSGTEANVVYTGDYNSAVNTQYPDWTKEGYTISWDNPIPATMPLNGKIITAKWIKNIIPSGGYSGRGSIRTNTIKQDSQTESQNDKNTENVIQSDSKESNNTPTNSSVNAPELQEILSPSDSSFTKEQKEAYEFAKEKGITTMTTINDANIEGNLTRIAMAKMLSYYAINVLGQTPDETRNNKFKDVSEKLDSDYDNGVTIAYQLGIMGINMTNNNFRPNDKVTRAEFATALSRMRYGTSDGEYEGTSEFYKNHINLLNKIGIIKIADPEMLELRGYVMIMLMRTTK